MKNSLMKLYANAPFLREEEGQDLVEYSVIIALIAFAAIAGMSNLANSINTGFNNIGTKVTSYT